DVRQAFAGVPAQLELEGVVASLADALVVEGRGDVGERTAQGSIPGSRCESHVSVSAFVQAAAMLAHVVGFYDGRGAEGLLDAEVPLLRVGVLDSRIDEPLDLVERSGGRQCNSATGRIERVTVTRGGQRIGRGWIVEIVRNLLPNVRPSTLIVLGELGGGAP